MHPIFYFNGDFNDPNTVAKMEQDFIVFLKQPFLPDALCGNTTTCNENTVTVYCGNVTVPEGRRRRSPIMQVKVNFPITVEFLRADWLIYMVNKSIEYENDVLGNATR